MYFQAGLTIAWFVWADNVVSVTFAGQEFHTYYLERSSTFELDSWTEVAARLGSGSEGRTLLLTLTDETATIPPAFYRIQCASECHQVGGN
jgi:hypothetical protein